MKKTIGGDRLGSGKKMQVDLHGYERSTHDLGYIFRSTMSAGTLVPFIKEIALPGDSFDIDLNADVKTHPTVGPLFGSYKLQIDVFQAPIRLYQGQLHNNKLGIGLKMNTVKFPLIEMMATNTYSLIGAPIPNDWDMDNYQINPSCIFSYLGIRGVGTFQSVTPGDQERYINAIPWLAYWDIYKNYYANKQEEIGAVIHATTTAVPHNVVDIEYDGTTIPHWPTIIPMPLTGNTKFTLQNTGVYQDPETIMIATTTGTGPQPLIWRKLSELTTNEIIVGATQTYDYNNSLPTGSYIYSWAYSDEIQSPYLDVVTFPLENLDTMREALLAATQNPAPVVIDLTTITPYKWALEKNATSGIYTKTYSQEGLAIKTYQSDILNNWLSTEWIDGAQGISDLTAVDTTGGSFTMDTLALSKKVYDMLNRIAISGGTYDDWMDAVYTHDRYTRAESPIYHGGLIKELEFQEVVSNAAAGDQPLATLAGKGVMGNKHKGGQITIKVDEPSYIIGIASLTPRLDYSQGNDWDIHLETMDDLHKPALDEIGFQELITEQMAWWDTHYNSLTSTWITKSAGKQPAWMNYMTNINKLRGNFAIKNNEMFMTLNRNYEPELNPLTPGQIDIKDLTTYIDPKIYNQIFADTALDSQNFWTQIAVNMTVRRKISAKIMPNL